MDMLVPRKAVRSSNLLNFPKEKYKFATKTSSDKNSNHLDSLCKRKMSNKIKSMEKKIKSMIATKTKVERKKSEKLELLKFRKPFSQEEIKSNDVSPTPSYQQFDPTTSPFVKPPQFSFPSERNLIEGEKSDRDGALYVRPNVYDSMEEEDNQFDEDKEKARRLAKMTEYLTFSAELAVFLSLIVGYFISLNEDHSTKKLIAFAILTDFTLVAYIFTLVYFYFKNCSDIKIAAVKYSLTWLVIDLVSCFPVSASILIKRTGLAQVNLILLIVRIVLLRKPNSAFGNLIMVPSNLEVNRLIKTMMLFFATIFYFAIYFRFVSERSLSFVDCLYFVVATSISVGYGDITPQNTKERLFTMALQVVGIIFYTLFISMVSGYISAMTPKKIILKEQMDILFEIYCDFDLPQTLYQKIKEYLTTSKDVSNANMIDLIKSLPITVSRELLDNTFKPTLERTPFFAKLSSNLASEMLSCINYVHYEKDEIVLQTGQLCEEVLIVSKGRMKFFSTLHDQRFALARIGSGQTFGEAQCFLKEQAICSLVNVSSIYKGFIVKSQDFDRLADEYKEEIGVLVDNSLAKQECLKSKLRLLKHCEKYDMTTEEIEQKMERINIFISDLEGEPESIRKAVNNYTSKNISYIESTHKLLKIKRKTTKRLRENINILSNSQPCTKKSTLNSIKAKKIAKISKITDKIKMSAVNDSMNKLKNKFSIFQNPEERLIEIINEKRRKSVAQERKNQLNLSRNNCKAENFNNYLCPFYKDTPLSFRKKDYSSSKLEEIFTPEFVPESFPLVKDQSESKLTVQLDKGKKFQTFSIDGFSVEVKMKKENQIQGGKLNIIKEMLTNLKNKPNC